MLKRIVLENFKSLKYQDFQCAQLNLLTGLNGSGKSSFIQFLVFLSKYAKKDISRELRCTCKELGLPGKYQDIRYCYAREDDLVRFLVDFEAKDNFCWSDGEVQGGSLDRVILPDYEAFVGADVIINDTEVYAHEMPFIKDWKKRSVAIHVASAHDDRSSLFPKTDEGEVWSKSHRELVKSVESRDKIKQSAFRSLWESARMVDAFRRKAVDVHRGSGQYGTEKDATRFSGAFDPEGDDVVEYIYKFGRIFKLDQDNPMIFPGSDLLVRKYDIDKAYFFKGKPDAYSIGEYFMDDPLKYDSNDTTQRKYSTLFEQVNAWLGVISPGAHLDIVREVVGDEEFYCEKVGFGKNEYAKAFRPQNVGFGISYVLPVLATVLTARPTDIIIIENPEAHLHPNGQSAIGKLLARAAAYGVQLFVETHSDHVINGIRVAVKQGILKANDVNIAFFDRRKHKVRYDEGVREEYYSDIHEIKVDRNGMLSNYPKGFLDEWDNQYYQLIR